jgi:hypothetical protein
LIDSFPFKVEVEAPFMLFSHRFGSVETLARAQQWLTELGFDVVKNDEPSHDASRLTLSVDFSKASAALALIDSIERSDPEGWPAYSAPSRTPHKAMSHAAACPIGHHDSNSCTPICWHSHEETSPADPVSTRVREYMLSRWE